MERMIRLGSRTVGGSCPVFVIAEAGCNCENDFARAQEMVAAAAEAGADAIKFQSFAPETLVTQDAPKFWDIPGPGKTQYEEFVEIQPRFSRAQYAQLSALARRHGILFSSTPSDEAWTDLLDDLGVPFFKIASMDITHLPLIRHVARKGKPVILSTGASFLEEVREAVTAILSEGNEDIVLLHCVSSYPALPSQANLRMMDHLAREFPQCVIGYSDHTLPDAPLSVPMLAVAAGAKVVEKHVTFDRSRPGYDHEISVDYAGLKEMVAAFRQVETALGNPVKAPADVEERTRRLGRRSIVAAVDIPKGMRILPRMLAIKRPGTGIEPKFLDRVIGNVAVADIGRDQVLDWTLLQEPSAPHGGTERS